MEADGALGAKGYGYDANGNMTNDGQFVYVWDNADRLKEVRTLDNSLVMSCRYDGMSRRRERVMNGETNRYVYHEWAVLEVRDGENSVIESYTHGPDLSGTLGGAGGIGGILHVAPLPEGAGSGYFFHYDANGNVVRLTDTDREIVSSLEYGPFGVVLVQSGPYTPRYQFSSKEFDSTVGLNYYGFRYYSPTMGRWLNRDPMGVAGGVNLVAFVRNSPITRVDSLGLQTNDPGFNWEQYNKICWDNQSGAIGIGIGGTGGSMTPPGNLFDYSVCKPGDEKKGPDYDCPCPEGSKQETGTCHKLEVCDIKAETPPGSTQCKIVSYWKDMGERGPFGCEPCDKDNDE